MNYAISTGKIPENTQVRFEFSLGIFPIETTSIEFLSQHRLKQFSICFMVLKKKNLFVNSKLKNEVEGRKLPEFYCEYDRFMDVGFQMMILDWCYRNGVSCDIVGFSFGSFFTLCVEFGVSERYFEY